MTSRIVSMAYRIGLDESAPRGIMRVVREQLDSARDRLVDAEMTEVERVHEFRKCLKKVRGAVRLVRPALGEEAYRKLNVWARDTARQFAHLRDADAMIEALARLDARYGAARRATRQSIEAAEAAFGEVRERAMREGRPLADLAAPTLDGLLAAGEQVARWQLSDEGFDTFRGGLAKTYERGRRAFRAAYRDATAERFHEWRKRVKYHWYHVRLLEGVWPAIMGTRRTTLDHLGELLGEHHDLAVLRQRVQAEWEEFDRRGAMLPLIEGTDLRQAEIHDEAQLIGRRMYAEPRDRFVQRLGDYWRASRAHRVPHEAPRTGASRSRSSGRRSRARGPAGAAS